jgi:uncharacterized membrane protein
MHDCSFSYLRGPCHNGEFEKAPFILVDSLVDFLHPNLSALIAAFFIAVARVLYRTALSRLSPGPTALVINIVSVHFAIAYYHLEGGLENWPIQGILWFLLVGLSAGCVGRYLNMLAMKLVGLARTGIFSQTTLIWSAVLSVLFLGEHMSLGVAVGTLAIMFGSILLVYEKERATQKVEWMHYLVPLAGAALAGIAHLFRKSGLIWMPSAGAGLGISNGSAALFMLAAIPFSKEGNPRGWDRRGIFVVILGGIFNGIAAMFFWSSLKTGQLVQIVPINRLSVLIVIFLSWLFFQKQENVTLRIVLGGLLSVAGAFAIVGGR